MDEITLSNLKVTVNQGVKTFTVDVDQQQLTLECAEELPHRSPANFFISCVLLKAMYEGKNIRLDDAIPFSADLAQALKALQKIYCQWNHKLTMVRVIGQGIQETAKAGYIASFFSGGVDGSYTLSEFPSINHVICLDTFEGRAQPEAWRSLVEKQKEFLAHRNIRLIKITSNYRQLTEGWGISHQFQHGLALGGVANFLGFEKTYVPSSFTSDFLFPWGSHPLTDPLWSGSDFEVIHHGINASRVDKTISLSRNSDLLDNLQVCWKFVDKNCGECHKCLRTMAALHLNGISSKAFPTLTDINKIAAFKVTSLAGVPFILELAELSEQKGHHEVAQKLRRRVRNFYLKYHFDEWIKRFTGNKLSRWKAKLSKQHWRTYRVHVTNQEQG